MVYCASLGSKLSTVWLKYLKQAFHTVRILSAERPDVVFVVSPPIFAIMTVWLWCRLHRRRYVVDAHTAAFLHPRWRHLQWLHDAFCRRALTTIVTNDHLADRLRRAGAHATIVRDVPVTYGLTARFDRGPEFSVAVVCSFNYDEPLAEIFRAAAVLDDVRFYMSGDLVDLDRSWLPAVPSNVTLTGFLPVNDYGSLLANADAVLTLTTRDHTMLRGAWEAIYQGTPVIVSDWPLLRESFDRGAIHVDNSAAQIVQAVREMRRRHAEYKAEAYALRERKQATWQSAKAALLARLTTSPRDTSTPYHEPAV
jgi:glycosyltransferase involved in cell wall biosynthesis